MPLALHNFVSPIRLDNTGVARIAASRVTLETLVSRFLSGDSAEEIADAYLLNLGDVYATLGYYLQHRVEVDAYLAEAKSDVEQVAKMIQNHSQPAALR